MVRVLVALLLLPFFCMGCESVHRGAQEVGKPIGSTFKTLGGVTEGAAETYADEEGPNPYGR